MATTSKLGELLTRAKLIDDRQLETAFQYQSTRGGKLGEILVSLGYVTEPDLLKLLAQQLSLQLHGEEEALGLAISDEVRGALPRFLAEEELIFPITYDRERRAITVLTHEPLDEATVDGIRIFANVDTVRTALTTKSAMRRLLAKHLPHKPHAGAAPMTPPPEARKAEGTGTAPGMPSAASILGASPAATPTSSSAPSIVAPSLATPRSPSAPPTADVPPSTLPLMPRVAAANPPAESPPVSATPASAPRAAPPPPPPPEPEPTPRPPFAPQGSDRKAPAYDPIDALAFDGPPSPPLSIPKPPPAPPAPPPMRPPTAPVASASSAAIVVTGWDDGASHETLDLGAPPPPPPPPPPKRASAPISTPQAATPSTRAIARRVLVVDRDLRLRSTVAVALAAEGHAVAEADDPRDVAVHTDFACDDLVIRDPSAPDAQTLALNLRRQNAFLEVRDIVVFAEALARKGEVQWPRLATFFFDLWDHTLRALDESGGNERARARLRSEFARAMGEELGLSEREATELHFASYVAGLGPIAQKLGFGGGAAGLRAWLEGAQCPFDLAEIMAPVPASPPAVGHGAPRMRIAACAARLAETSGAGLGVRELLDRLGFASESPDLAMAAMRVLARRGELSLPQGIDGREVVIVDTDTRVAGELWTRFIAEGFSARLFHDGTSAMKYMSDRPPALVIAEVDLPGLSGLDLATTLKGTAATRDAKLFFLSREADPQVIMRGLAAGAEDYLIKPANFDLLLIKARRVLGRP